MKAAIIALISILYFSPPAKAQTEASVDKNYNLKKSLAIEGYDPVSYFSEKPTKGKSGFSFKLNGATYLFANQGNLAKFKSNPEKYEPAYGGWCAYAMGESGEKVKVDPETYKVTDGKLYLFYNFWGSNTLTDWNKNEKVLKATADKNWKKIIQ